MAKSSVKGRSAAFPWEKLLKKPKKTRRKDIGS
jgi:hypothetical protein